MWAALAAVPLMLLSVISGGAAWAAGNSQVIVSVIPINLATNATLTTLTPGQAVGFRVDVSCVTEICVNTTVKFDPTQLDPNHDFYRLLAQTGFTPPLSGGTLTGDAAAGYTVSLGDLAAGSQVQFVVEYTSLPQAFWTLGAVRSNFGPSNFPNGFQVVQTVRGNADTAIAESSATSAPSTWSIPGSTPAVAVSGMSGPGGDIAPGGVLSTDTNYTFFPVASSGCVTQVNTNSTIASQNKLCASDYTVTQRLPVGAELVSAFGNPTVSGTVATGLVLTWKGADWAPTGDTSQLVWGAQTVGSAQQRHNIVIRFPRENLAPAGQTCNYDAQTTGPKADLSVTYISMPGMPGEVKTASIGPGAGYAVRCADPFPRGEADPKTSTFDGSQRVIADQSPVAIPATGQNLKEWRVTVANTANIPGVAVVTDNNLDLQDLPVYQIVAPTGSTIAWTATNGTMTVSGTSTTTANAPVEYRFVTSTVTSPTLAAPNRFQSENFRTTFTVRYLYSVTPDGTPGATRTNTASARMTYPDYSQFADIPLTIPSHTVLLAEPFSRASLTKSVFYNDAPGSAQAGPNIPIPGSGTQTGYWNILASNTGNVPAVPTVTDLALDLPDMSVTAVSTSVFDSGSYTAVDSAINYTLDNGVTGTVTTVGGTWTAPAGRRIVAATAKALAPIRGGSTIPEYNNAVSYVVSFAFAVPAGALPATNTNTASMTMDYSNFGVPDRTGSASSSATLVSSSPVITATLPTATIQGGATSATTSSDVTFRLAGSTSGVPSGRTVMPQYVFVAPQGWNITPGSASFPAGSIPAGVQFTYRTATIAGVSRQVVVASWPAGTAFPQNTTLPTMSLIARPSATVAAATQSRPLGYIGNTNPVLAGDVFTTPFTDAPDLDGDGSTVERFATANNSQAIPVAAVAAMQVLKEICLPDVSQPGGCRWYSDPSINVGVPPNSTSIKYRISATNTGNTALSNIVGYDILPYIGDTGTSDATGGTTRGSTFRETVASVTTPTNSATATYSDSTQPCRTEVDITVPGCVNDWDSSPAGAQAIRIARAGSLAPGGSFSMEYTAGVSNAPGFGAIACNSFAVRATGLGNVSEPAPVCAAVEETDLEVVAGTPQLQSGRPGMLPWTVTNLGGAPSTQGEVEVAVPAGLDVTSLTPTGWVCTAVDGAGNPVFVTIPGPATLTCVPNDALQLGVPRALDVPVRAKTASAMTSTTEVSGLMFDGNLSNNRDAMSVDPTAAAGDIGVTKDDGVTTAVPGQTLTYTITVTNPLNFESLVGGTLTDLLPPGVVFVSASDGGTESGGTVTWALPDIAADGTLTRTVTVRVSPTVSVATLVNEATVSVPDPGNPGGTLTGADSDTDAVLTDPSVQIEKGSVLPTFATAGDVVDYTFTVENTGDVTLTAVSIADVLPGISDPMAAVVWPTTTAGVLAPGERATATGQYTITQDDVDAGRVLNTATVTATPPAGGPVRDSDAHTVTGTAVPHLTLTKLGEGEVLRAGDVVVYTFTVLNDSPLTLQNVSINDPRLAGAQLSYDWPGDVGVLAPGQSATASASYRATQTDVDAGQIVNTAQAAGRTSRGVSTSDDDTFTVTIDAVPTIELIKDASYRPGERGEAGDTIEYKFTATNTGNVTLTGVVVDDPLPGLSARVYVWPGVPGVLTPGQTVVATATYVVTQADVDGPGQVTNTATAIGQPPVGGTVSGQDTVTMDTPEDAGIQVVKTASIDGGDPVRAGDIIRYRFEVRNVGVVTLHAVDLLDEMTGLSDIELTWPDEEGILAPAAILVGTASYTLTQGDLDVGQVVNTANALGTTPEDLPVSDEDTATVLLPAAPATTLEKTATVDEGVWQQGDAVSYRFVITNIGNVTLHAVAVTDAMPGLSAITYQWPGEQGVLAPGESVIAQAGYVLSGRDAAARSLTNTATAISDRAPDVEDSVTLEGPPPPSVPFGGLAFTGAATGVGVVVSVVLLGAGLLLLLVRRGARRRQARN